MDPDPIGWQILLQAVLLLLYAILAGAESAAHQISLNRSHRVAENEDRRIEKMRQSAQGLIATPSGIRICMMLAVMAAAGFAVWHFALPLVQVARELWRWTWLDAPGMTRLAIFMVMLLLVFMYQLLGATIPRRIASQKPKMIATRLFPFAKAVSLVFRPMAITLDKLSSFFLRAMRIETMQETEDITEDEIRMLVDVGEEKGAIQEAERKMIENVFEFNNMTATDCMTHRTDMFAVWIEDTVEEIIVLIEETGLSRFPVYNEDLDDIIGTVTTRDFLLNLQRDEPKPFAEILREAKFVPESVRTDVLFRDMQRNKYHMAIVVDEYGGTSGLITMEDLLEEIVGKIYDEYDPQVQQDFETLDVDRWRVSGGLDIETFNDLTGLELPLEEDFDTIGGLILSQMSSIPDDGTQPEIDGFGLHFKVQTVQDRRIEWVEVKKNAEV